MSRTSCKTSSSSCSESSEHFAPRGRSRNSLPLSRSTSASSNVGDYALDNRRPSLPSLTPDREFVARAVEARIALARLVAALGRLPSELPYRDDASVPRATRFDRHRVDAGHIARHCQTPYCARGCEGGAAREARPVFDPVLGARCLGTRARHARREVIRPPAKVGSAKSITGPPRFVFTHPAVSRVVKVTVLARRERDAIDPLAPGRPFF